MIKSKSINDVVNSIMQGDKMNGDCMFIIELEETPHIAKWNLITSIGALKLWNKGIKPSRHWKISQVKKYFGMNGNKKVLLAKLETLNKIIKGEI